MWMRHVTRMNVLFHTCKCIVSHVWMRRVIPCDAASCHTCECVIPQIWMRHVTHTHTSWHKSVRVSPHMTRHVYTYPTRLTHMYDTSQVTHVESWCASTYDNVHISDKTHSYVWHESGRIRRILVCVSPYDKTHIETRPTHICKVSKIIEAESWCVSLSILTTCCLVGHTQREHMSYVADMSYVWHAATHCNTLQHTATHCNTLMLYWWYKSCLAYCNTLQHTATHCNTLQHTATHCNTLQHTALVLVTRVSGGTGWRRLIGSPKLQIIFHKRATKYRSLLRKMTYKDKGSYDSSPPCSGKGFTDLAIWAGNRS